MYKISHMFFMISCAFCSLGYAFNMTVLATTMWPYIVFWGVVFIGDLILETKSE